jgi:AcrR family transcriptional regulator
MSVSGIEHRKVQVGITVDGSQLRRGGRAPAGTDREKRRQILEAAKALFSTLGYDAASMNDIAKLASVSKGTLYVYFENKEELFIALIAAERDKHAVELFATLTDDPDIEHALHNFGTGMARLVCRDDVLRANRIILGVSDRMPDIGRRFFELGPLKSAQNLAAMLDRHVIAGELVIDDTLFAAVQFLELCQATLMRPRLFQAVTAPPSDDQIVLVVRNAVSMFLRAYRNRDAKALPAKL